MKKRVLFLFLFVLSILFYGCSVEEVPEIIKEVPLVEEELPEEAAELPKPEPVEVVKEIEEAKEPELSSGPIVIEKPKPCGSFFDAYTRITGGPQDSGDVKESELASLLATRMQENGVGCALLVGVDVTDFDSPQQIKESVDYYYNILKLYPNTFVPLLDIDADTASEITVDLIKQVFKEAEGKIDYQGFGEVSFVDPGPWKNKKLTDQPLPEIIEFLGENNLILAAHLRDEQTSELETILSKYPRTKILVHGKPKGTKELLVKHKNLYYAAELEIMLAGGTFGCSTSVTDSNVNSAVKEYAPIIAAAPNQVLWGTNAHSQCHFQPGFYPKLIEFSNKFIQKLPEEHRQGFAHGNAEKLVGLP